MDPMVRIALRAARRASAFLLNTFDRPPASRMGRIALKDFSDRAQRKVLELFADAVHLAYPTHEVRDARESKERPESYSAPFTWRILPLEGIENYQRSLPNYCSLIGIYDQARLQHAIILDYVHDNEYWATAQEGARVDQQRMRVSTASQLKDSVVAVVPPKSEDERLRAAQALMVREVEETAIQTRRSGSTVLDIAQVAHGKVDAVLACDIDEVVHEPAVLFIKEAGGYATVESTADPILGTATLIAGAPKVFNELSVLSLRVRRLTEANAAK